MELMSISKLRDIFLLSFYANIFPFILHINIGIGKHPENKIKKNYIIEIMPYNRS